jgi:hypothetical protein
MVRIQFELPEEKVSELKKLMDESGIKTRKDLLNNALMLLEWAISERRAGRTIVSVDEKKNRYKEVLMPILSSIARA